MWYCCIFCYLPEKRIWQHFYSLQINNLAFLLVHFLRFSGILRIIQSKEIKGWITSNEIWLFLKMVQRTSIIRLNDIKFCQWKGFHRVGHLVLDWSMELQYRKRKCGGFAFHHFYLFCFGFFIIFYKVVVLFVLKAGSMKINYIVVLHLSHPPFTELVLFERLRWRRLPKSRDLDKIRLVISWRSTL